jgi:hypothetical protein
MAAQDGDRFAIRRVPQPHRPVPRSGGEALPVRAEGQRRHLLRMAAQGAGLGAGLHVPQVDGVIVRGVGEVPAVAGENGRVGPLEPARKVGALSPRRDVPELELLVLDAQEQAAVRAA